MKRLIRVSETLPTMPARDTKPPKDHARNVAKSSAVLFQQFTGKKPTASVGTKDPISFVNFLRDIFRICEIDASAQTYAKEL